MPLTTKGEEIKHAMEKSYGTEKGEKVFYASKNAGKITGVDEMNNGVEGLKSYTAGDDDHHHEFKGETGPEIEDKKKHHDAFGGLVNAKEEPEAAAHDANPKAFDAKFTHEFPNDPFGDKNPQGGFSWEQVESASGMKNSPLAQYHED